MAPGWEDQGEQEDSGQPVPSPKDCAILLAAAGRGHETLEEVIQDLTNEGINPDDIPEDATLELFNDYVAGCEASAVETAPEIGGSTSSPSTTQPEPLVIQPNW